MRHCEHHHNHSHHLVGRKLWIAILLNSGITIAQILAGLLSGSLSLLSDALHNFSDVIALLLTYFAHTFTRRQNTPEKTFGYKRAEIIAALINTATLLALAVLLCKEAFSRFVNPVEVSSEPIIALGILSIVINLGSVLLIRKEAKHSLNIRSAYLHLFTDILSSIAVVIGGFLIYWTKLYWIDSLLTLVIACYLVYSSWHIMSDIMRIIMHFTPDHIDIKAVEKELTEHVNVANVHHVHIWQLTDDDVHFEAHVDFEKDLPLSEVAQTIHHLHDKLYSKFGIRHSVIQPEIGIHDSKNLIATECHN